MSLYHVEHPKPEFPRLKYAPTGGSVMVANATEERALGPFWSDNPPASKPSGKKKAEKADA